VKRYLLVEAFIQGNEIAVEGMLYAGQLQLLTIFDKPDVLDGPYFEETYYITPTTLNESMQQLVCDVLQQACDAYGLSEGPIHAECRLYNNKVYIIEIAARTIGGLCARLLNVGTGYSLEEIVLSHAMGNNLQIKPQQQSAGVLMIPIPQAGILKRVEGLLAAQSVANIEEISIQIREGHELLPLPEGSSYLGFIFAFADTPKQVEQALRAAHAHLKFVVAPLWKLSHAS
jgi:biotin carboxylase